MQAITARLEAYAESPFPLAPTLPFETFQRHGVAAAEQRQEHLDLAVVHQNAPLALLRNEAAGPSLKLRFRGSTSNRTGVNVRVWVTQGERTVLQELAGGTSYCVTHFPELVFAAGEATSRRVRVRWPSGTEHEYPALTPDRTWIVDEDGAVWPAPKFAPADRRL